MREKWCFLIMNIFSQFLNDLTNIWATIGYLALFISKEFTQFRKAIRAKERLGVTLRYYVTRDEQTTIAASNRVTPSTVCRKITERQAHKNITYCCCEATRNVSNISLLMFSWKTCTLYLYCFQNLRTCIWNFCN